MITESRIGDDVSRFATKKHLCSYAGVVPKANNSGEFISEHNHVKQGDIVLKYALTCAVRGAILANNITSDSNEADQTQQTTGQESFTKVNPDDSDSSKSKVAYNEPS